MDALTLPGKTEPTNTAGMEPGERTEPSPHPGAALKEQNPGNQTEPPSRRQCTGRHSGACRCQRVRFFRSPCLNQPRARNMLLPAGRPACFVRVHRHHGPVTHAIRIALFARSRRIRSTRGTFGATELARTLAHRGAGPVCRCTQAPERAGHQQQTKQNFNCRLPHGPVSH